MQNKTDKKTSLVSKSLPVRNFNFVNCLFSERKKKYYVSIHGTDRTFTHQGGDGVEGIPSGCFFGHHVYRAGECEGVCEVIEEIPISLPLILYRNHNFSWAHLHP